ncbi:MULTISPECIES: hypothetical protein [Enterobacter]|uniref:hypothetical protein n=1 Tax=Enterobacter TaxID=547 RepID=UPI002004B8D4|nr:MULTISPECIES: hypothetical protein [Enterobacter]MCK7307894.1 hypothetical protein [Enterobacter quasiroggenkampii]MEB6185340.1 hypothetical protein [Enterobacter roggenkampii]
MAVFAVVATHVEETSRPNVRKQIHDKFTDTQFLEVADCLWFVDAEFATSKDLTLFLSGEDNANQLSSFIVLPVTSYYGLHNMIVWEWLAAKGL